MTTFEGGPVVAVDVPDLDATPDERAMYEAQEMIAIVALVGQVPGAWQATETGAERALQAGLVRRAFAERGWLARLELTERGRGALIVLGLADGKPAPVEALVQVVWGSVRDDRSGAHPKPLAVFPAAFVAHDPDVYAARRDAAEHWFTSQLADVDEAVFTTSTARLVVPGATS